MTIYPQRHTPKRTAPTVATPETMRRLIHTLPERENFRVRSTYLAEAGKVGVFVDLPTGGGQHIEAGDWHDLYNYLRLYI